MLLRAVGAALLLVLGAPDGASAQALDAVPRVGGDVRPVRCLSTMAGADVSVQGAALYGGERCGSVTPWRPRAVTPLLAAGAPVQGAVRSGRWLDPLAGARSAAAGGRAMLLPDLPEGHSPEGALRRALLPGWGQIYNRQYYKLPFVYAGLAAFVGGVVWTNQQYLLHRHAALYLQWRNDEGVPDPSWQRYQDAYADVVGDTTNSTVTSRQIRDVRDNLRRNRDLLVIGSVLYYGLTILDAYVSAHLVAFDVGEDLSAAIRMPSGARPVLAVRVRL